MTAIFAILVMSMTITSIVDYAKMVVVDRKIQWQVFLAIVLGIFTAWAYQLSLFDILGITTKIPYISYVATGILMSRGANWIYDFFSQALKYKAE